MRSFAALAAVCAAASVLNGSFGRPTPPAAALFLTNQIRPPTKLRLTVTLTFCATGVPLSVRTYWNESPAVLPAAGRNVKRPFALTVIEPPPVVLQSKGAAASAQPTTPATDTGDPSTGSLSLSSRPFVETVALVVPTTPAPGARS